MFVLVLLIVSVCAGLLLKNLSILKCLERTSTWTVWLLIFVFGISLGSNESIVSDFGRFGLSALLIALAGVAGSVLSAWCITGFIDRDKRE